MKKTLYKAPKRLQSLLLRSLQYNFTLEYHSGKSIPVAYSLSICPLPDKPRSETTSVNNVSLLSIRSSRLNDIRLATSEDNTMSELKTMIMEGWPTDRSWVLISLTPYYHYRDELFVHDGIILRGERVVIPTAMRPEIKMKVHAGHQGINSCLRRAREFIYWSGMSSEIRQYVESCDSCDSYVSKQTPETLHMHEVPTRPFQKVRTDLFTIGGKDYLITVDYHSHYFEVDYCQLHNLRL